jgi:ribosomal protein L37AE/L43A
MKEEKIVCPDCKGSSVVQTAGGKIFSCDTCPGTGYVVLFSGKKKNNGEE